MESAKTTPTWGYHATEQAQIFHLAEGEGLPEGWHDSPAAIPAAEPNEGSKEST